MHYIQISNWWWQNGCDPVHRMIMSTGYAAPWLCPSKTEALWWNRLICNPREILNYVKQYVDLCRYSRKGKNRTEIHNWHHLFMLRICFSLCGSYLGALSTPICQGQWLWFRLFSVDAFHVGTRTCSEGWGMGTGGIWGVGQLIGKILLLIRAITQCHNYQRHQPSCNKISLHPGTG